MKKTAVKNTWVLLVLVIAMTASGCSLFGGDDGEGLTTAEDVEPLATVPIVAPADEPLQPATGAGDAATAPLPTAVTLPPTPIPPEPTVDRSQPTTYVVQAGDVLGLIAERFDVDIAELRRINGLSGNLIKVGQELTIPASGGATAPVPGATSAPVATPRPTTAPAPVSCGGGQGHCVQAGDSLTGIAAKYGVSLESLRAANPGVNGDFINIGQLLTIPGSTGPSPTTPPVTGGTPVPTTGSVVASDADCAAISPGFPFFHATDGLCYANPVGGPTTVPTPVGGCEAGYFFYEPEGLCFPIPTPTADPAVTPTVDTTQTGPDYGSPPCRDGYVDLGNNKCWPIDTTTPATVTPTGG